MNNFVWVRDQKKHSLGSKPNETPPVESSLHSLRSEHLMHNASIEAHLTAFDAHYHSLRSFVWRCIKVIHFAHFVRLSLLRHSLMMLITYKAHNKLWCSMILRSLHASAWRLLYIWLRIYITHWLTRSSLTAFAHAPRKLVAQNSNSYYSLHMHWICAHGQPYVEFALCREGQCP